MGNIIRGPWSPLEQLTLPLGATHPHHIDPPGYYTQLLQRFADEEIAFAKKRPSESIMPAPNVPAFPPDLWAAAQKEQDEYEEANACPVPQVWPVGD